MPLEHSNVLFAISMWIAAGIIFTTLRLAYTSFGYDCARVFPKMPIAITIVVVLHVLTWAFANIVIRAFWSWGCALNISHFRRYSR